VRQATIVIGDEFFENTDAVLETGDILVKVEDNAAELGSLAFGLAAAGACPAAGPFGPTGGRRCGGVPGPRCARLPGVGAAA
jgi:hypothetical protein